MIYVRSCLDAGGYDSQGKRYVILDLLCDTDADLPATNYFSAADVIIAQGSTAESISSGAKYQMQSDGTWTLRTAGTAAYTKAEIDAMFAGVYTKAETDDLISDIDFCAVGTTIPQNADLNDAAYRKKGVYSCGASTAATLINCPVSMGFRMEVVQIAFSTLYQQRLFPQSRVGDSFYVRTSGFVNGVFTWGSWYQYTGTAI